MTTFTVVQVRRNIDLEWMVERSPHGDAFHLPSYYLSEAEADTEAGRLTAMEKTREDWHLGAASEHVRLGSAPDTRTVIYSLLKSHYGTL